MANEMAGCSNSFEHLYVNGPPFKPPLRKQAVCFCCYATDVPLTNVKKCNHKEFVKGYLSMAPSIQLLICNICHHMLKKIEDFRLQVQNNFRSLVSKKEADGRCVMVNNLNRNPKITITSLNPIKNAGSQEDPLFEPRDSFLDNSLGTPTIKTEPEESQNTAASKNNKETNTPSGTQYFMEITPTNIKQEPMPPSQLDNPTITIKNGLILYPIKNKTEQMKAIPFKMTLSSQPRLATKKKNIKKVTNIRTVKKHNTLFKSANNPLNIQQKNETKINFKGIANNYIDEKVHNSDDSEREPTSEIGKLLMNYEYRKLDYSRRDKLYNPDKYKSNKKIDKITNYKDTVIDESYKNKIHMITLTETEIIKERDNERLEELFAKSMYRCESCIESFQFDFSLERHNERFHSKKDNDAECPICKRRYMSEKNMEDHSRKHFVRYVCLVCNLKSKTLPSLTLHYNETHTDKESIKMKYECKECNFVSYYKGTYNHHRYNNHKLFMCKVCNKKLTGGASYKYHMKFCHDDNKAKKNKALYNCDQCTASFANCGLYTYHKKTVHALPGMEPTPVFCQPCNKFLSNKVVYKSHLKYSSAHAKGVLKFECDYCHKIFPYKPTLVVHIQKEHLKNVNLKCPICNKTFGANRDLTQHVRRVHTNKNLPREVCYVCGKDYVSKAVLKKHIRIHTGERPHACDLCGLTFTQSSTLYTHRKLKHKIPKKADIETK